MPLASGPEIYLLYLILLPAQYVNFNRHVAYFTCVLPAPQISGPQRLAVLGPLGLLSLGTMLLPLQSWWRVEVGKAKLPLASLSLMPQSLSHTRGL